MKSKPSRLRWVGVIGVVAMVLVGQLIASDLRVNQVSLIRHSDKVAVEVNIAWSNAWRNRHNYDAVWVTLRSVGRPERMLLPLAATGHQVLDGGPVAVTAVEGRGVFISARDAHRGDIECRVSLALDPSRWSGVFPEQIEAWALEMVFVPAGPFQSGDDHREAVNLGALYQVGDVGRPAGPFSIASEEEIRIENRTGALYYQVGDVPQYRGDQQGPLPAEFPKGTQGFYIMKYELTQGQYARFLNSLPQAWLMRRANHQVEHRGAESNTIAEAGGHFRAGTPSRSANFVSWDDTSAYFDWMALRPMTELEFEKASRGPRRPVPLDFPWGTDSRERLARKVTASRDLTLSSSSEEGGLTEETRDVFGASYYWVMDLSGGLWERVVSIGHPAGRAFRGSHGDGVLDPVSGQATNLDWPRGDGGRSVDGIGYRGGAEYFKPPDFTNPNSPVAVRTFAAWNGAFRSPTYSARGVRTAPR